MKPPQFILNSQGVITHKIVPQGNGKYRAFPANANGKVISEDPNKSPTLDESNLMLQLGAMEKNGAKVIYDVPENNVEVPEAGSRLPVDGMSKVTDNMAPVDAELIKKYTDYQKQQASPIIDHSQPPVSQNNKLFPPELDNSKEYDYEKTPEFQAAAQIARQPLINVPAPVPNAPVTTTTGTTTTTGVAANNGATSNPPAPAVKQHSGFADKQTYSLLDAQQNPTIAYRKNNDGSYRVYDKKTALGFTDLNSYKDIPEEDLDKMISEKKKEGFITDERDRDVRLSKPNDANKSDNSVVQNNQPTITPPANTTLPPNTTQSTSTPVTTTTDKKLAPITTTDATGKAVTTTKLEGDTNGNGVIDGDEISEDAVLTVEKPIAEIATNAPFSTSPFTRRVTHGIWEPFGNDEDSSMEYRTRPIKRIYTDPQQQDTSTATVVNEFLGKTFGSREDKQERRDNRRYENDRRNDREDTRNKGNDKADDEKILEGKEEKVRRRGPLFQNPMIDVARNVVNGKEKMPEFDNVRDARQFHRAVKQAQTFIRREDATHNRNAAKYDRDQDRLQEIRRKTEERLGIKYQTPNSPSQGNTSLPTSPTIDNNQTKTSSDVLSDINNNIFQNNKFNTMLNPPIYKGPVLEGKPNPLLKITEQVDDTTPLKTKQSGGQIMQNGSRINRPLFDTKLPKQNNANWNLDGLDQLPEYKFKENASADLLKKRFQPSTIYGADSQKINTSQNGTSQDAVNRAFDIKPGNKTGIVADPINFIEGTDDSKKTTTTQSGSTGAPYWNSRKLNVFGNQMQHEANMYPVMYNVGKSLFDKAEVQNPIYNKQDVAFLQGMKRNQIGLNMNPINDNRAAMNQAIRGNARGSGQILNAYAAAQNAASKNMNDEMYRVKNANQAQENNYLNALNQVGNNRREIDTLVDEKNRQHRLSFEKFQRDALESGEKAQINKGQMINQELSDKITMDNYLNQIGKNFQYKLQGDGTYMIEFEDFSGNKRKMSPNQTKATMEILQKGEQDKQNTRQAELNAQAANDEKLKQNALTEEQRVKLKAYEDAEIRAAKEKKWNDEQAAKAKAEADAKAKGTNKTGGYIYKRKSF